MTMHQFSAGIDSLYWSAPCGIDPRRFSALRQAREGAAETGSAQPWHVINGFTLSIGAHGAGRYPVFLDCHEFRIQITDSHHLPTVYVQLRSAFIHTVGFDAAYVASLAVVERLTGVPISNPSTSRVDLYVDFAGWVVRRDDLRGLVTNAKIATHGRAGTDELETVMVGKSPMAVRVYRKDIEVRERGGFAPEFWDGYDGPVIRVEVQASAAALRTLQIVSVVDCLRCHGDVWRWATGTFVVWRAFGSGSREDWALTAEWATVQAVTIKAFPICGRVPARVVQGNRQKVIPALLGYLSTYAALENVWGPLQAVAHLVREFPDLTALPTRRFEDEVARKRALLPKPFREVQELESARDRSPSPEGGDIEGSTVGSDA